MSEKASPQDIQRLRDYIDSVNAARGINWKDAFAQFSAGDAKGVEEWLYKNYDMDRAQANRYAQALRGMRYMELTGTNTYSPGRDFIDSLVNEQNPNAQQNAQVDANERRRADITNQLQAFVDELRRDVDMSDPVFAGLIRAGQAEAGAAINQSGVRGGLADLTTAEAAQRNALPYLAQRRQMLQQGLGMLSNRDISLEQLDQGWNEINMKRTAAENQLAMQQWAEGKNKAQGIGAAIGGGVGLVGGLIATGVTAGSAAPLVPALVAGGSALGGGIGGMTAGEYRPKSYSSGRSPSSFSGY